MATPSTTPSKLPQDVAPISTWEEYLKLESVKRNPTVMNYAGRVRRMGVPFDKFKRMLANKGSLAPAK